MGFGSFIDSSRACPLAASELQSSSISPDGLHTLLNEKCSDVIVLDVRSFLCFNQQHVNNAININLPSALIKRRGLSSQLFDRAICHPSDRARFLDRALKTIVIYEDGTPHSESVVIPLRNFLAEEGLAADVRFLVGGFQAMRASYPSDCRLVCSTLAALFRSHSDVKLAPKTLHTDTVRCPEPILIVPNLYLGDESTAANHDALVRNHIGHVLNAAKECENTFERSSSFHYKRLNLVDNPNQCALMHLLDESIEFLNSALEKGQGVLVHCKAGQSRSVTVVLAYLMRTNGWTLAHAYSYVQARKPDISPNLGFMGQLITFESRLRSSSSPAPLPVNSNPVNVPATAAFARPLDMPLSYSVS